MTDPQTPKAEGDDFPSFVPASNTTMSEFTIRALLLGLLMCVILGAANAYLGLRAGMTIAATYPAAVIGMAVLRLFKGSILEENMARTVGSVGESIAAGAIFTLPAFFLAKVWPDFSGTTHYLEATTIMLLGGVLGIFFVTMLRRVMVEDAELPYPESVAAGEIHKAGRSGGAGAKYLFNALILGAIIQLGTELKLFLPSYEKFVSFSKGAVNLLSGKGDILTKISTGGGALIKTPAASPAFIGVGYIIGPRLAALNFAGGLLAWGLFVPLLMFFVGPSTLESLVSQSGDSVSWASLAVATWKGLVRPIAIGGMLVSAGYTLYKMRKNLARGFTHSLGDIKKAAGAGAAQSRLDKDISFKFVAPMIFVAAVLMGFLYYHFCGNAAASIVAAVVMLVAGFFFAAVSGYLVGLIGSSNNPVSGLTVSTLIVAALLMVFLGVSGITGVAAVLGVAAVVCVSSAVAGEMLQDLKVGHILGGTPWKMQIGNIIGVIVASSVMFLPLMVLHQGDINRGGTGFGGASLSAPQAGLMAMLAQGIVAHEMAWPLVIVGMLMAVAMICVQVRSPMLVSVGMYLPFEVSATIFLGGVIRSIADCFAKKRKLNAAQKIRMDNNGILLASGFIAGEALMGLVIAALAFKEVRLPEIFKEPSFIGALVVFVLLAFILVRYPLKNAGSPDEPAPPSAMV
ncbi:MAG: oligopeptide transporter, OPT family [Pseudomonadota bacterium]